MHDVRISCIELLQYKSATQRKFNNSNADRYIKINNSIKRCEYNHRCLFSLSIIFGYCFSHEIFCPVFADFVLRVCVGMFYCTDVFGTSFYCCVFNTWN